MEFNQNFQVYNKLQSLTGLYYNESYENSKKTKLIIVTILQWHKYKMGFPKKINLCSTYVNKISLKYLKKYLPWNLLKFYFIGEYHCCIQFHFMEYNYIFNTPEERNEFF